MTESGVILLTILIIFIVVGIILLIIFLIIKPNENQKKTITELQNEVKKLNEEVKNDNISLGNIVYPIRFFNNRRPLLRRLIRRYPYRRSVKIKLGGKGRRRKERFYNTTTDPQTINPETGSPYMMTYNPCV